LNYLNKLITGRSGS